MEELLDMSSLVVLLQNSGSGGRFAPAQPGNNSTLVLFTSLTSSIDMSREELCASSAAVIKISDIGDAPSVLLPGPRVQVGAGPGEDAAVLRPLPRRRIRQRQSPAQGVLRNEGVLTAGAGLDHVQVGSHECSGRASSTQTIAQS